MIICHLSRHPDTTERHGTAMYYGEGGGGKLEVHLGYCNRRVAQSVVSLGYLGTEKGGQRGWKFSWNNFWRRPPWNWKKGLRFSLGVTYMNPRILDRANIMEEMVESELEMDVDVVLKWESWNWGPWRLCWKMSRENCGGGDCAERRLEEEKWSMRIVLKGGGRRPEHQCWCPPPQWSPPPQLQFTHRPPNSNLPKLQLAIWNLKRDIRACCLLPLPMGCLGKGPLDPNGCLFFTHQDI